MRRIKKNSFEHIYKKHIKWFVLMIIGVGLGILYTLLKRTYEPMFFLLYTFIKEEQLGVGEVDILKHTIITYGVQILIIWGCGLFKATKMLMYMFFVGFVFCYGFSVSILLVMYGIKGIGIILLLFGVQMILMIGLFILIGICSENKHENPKIYTQKGYMRILAISLGVVGCVGVQNTYVQPFFENIIQNII